ncbi:MAG: class C sortase [Candidatus Spyradocola sp.]
MKNKKGTLTTVLLVAVLLVGLGLLLYPTFSDYWNSLHQTRAIQSYTTEASTLDTQQYEQMLLDAQAYNARLAAQGSSYKLTDAQLAEYDSLLNLSGNGVMGYIEIPSIDCSLPVYHGTNDSVLQVAIGHLEWTSLPVGGEGSHCVLSGHRGLPSAKLFTNLDKLQKGDVFMLRVLEEQLTYEVDQILIVEPHELDALQIEAGKDYCTLVTCTPYGINTHRLLVRGHRIENAEEVRTVRVTADAVLIDPLTVAPIVSIPLLLLLLVLLLPNWRTHKRHRGDENDAS